PMAGAQVLECEPALHNAKLIHRQNSGKPGLRNFVAALDEALRDPVGRLGIAILASLDDGSNFVVSERGHLLRSPERILAIHQEKRRGGIIRFPRERIK